MKGLIVGYKEMVFFWTILFDASPKVLFLVRDLLLEGKAT